VSKPTAVTPRTTTSEKSPIASEKNQKDPPDILRISIAAPI
jgi:hypothetical protein